MHARGAEVTITKESIEVTRSELAKNLWNDASLPASELIGWYKVAPDDCSPGYIDLLNDSSPIRINFSAGEFELFEAINSRLTQLQAGYELDDTAVVPTESEWIEDVAQQKLEEKTKKKAPKAPWSKVATPDVVPETNTDADIDGAVYGQVVCVTGDVEPYSKGDVWNMIAQAGGRVSKSVTKKTTMLVVGEWASMTSKEKRARALKDKGQEIQIVAFEDFLTLV